MPDLKSPAAGEGVPVSLARPKPAMLEKLKSLKRELGTYRRELPRLLAEGEEGRFVVIRGEQLLGTWDTYRDASQYAREKFDPDQLFLLQRIDARYAALLSQLFPEQDAPCPS
jgi:hypothetical protein